MIRATISAATHTGWVRKRNEDWFGATGLPEPEDDGDVVSVEVDGAQCLAVVADGLGGHPAGDVASRRAVDYLMASRSDTPGSLTDALHGANEDLYSAMSAEAGTVGMGATIAAVLMTESGVVSANVGDTKAFEMARDALQQLTIDDVPPIRTQLPGFSTSVVTQSLGGRENESPRVSWRLCSLRGWSNARKWEISRRAA